MELVAIVLTGTTTPGEEGLTAIDLDGGGHAHSTERAEGHVAITAVGGRVRLGLAAGQPLVAEVSDAAIRDLDLHPGARITATSKAPATRVVAA